MNRSVPVSVSALLLAAPLLAQEPTEAAAAATVRLGEGAHSYEWVADWGRLPSGEDLGNTHGCVVVDKAGRIYFNTDTERAVVVFDADGSFVGAWGKEFQGGLHGMTIVTETVGSGEDRKEQEFLYLAHTGRSEVAKATLDGEVLWTLGYPKMAGIYKEAKEYRPTSIAVAPNGEFWVADGYGKSWIHHYNKDREYLKSFGGPGSEPGQLRTPHGMMIDTRGDEPRLIVADRENHRLQVFDLDGKLVGMVTDVLRRPCNIHAHGSDLVVADLAGRVTILGEDNALVCHLGDNPDPGKRAQNGVPRDQWQAGHFISPHSACWDHDGNLYVMDWLRLGRVTKLARLR